jgi:hypothetical protein
VSRVREVLLLLGPRSRVPAEGEMLLLQRGDIPKRRATRASGSGTGAAGPQTRRRGSARRRDSDSGDLRLGLAVFFGHAALAESLRQV